MLFRSQEAIEREISRMRATLANPQVLARLQTPQGTAQAAEETQEGASPAAQQAPAAPQAQNGASKHSLHDLLKRLFSSSSHLFLKDRLVLSKKQEYKIFASEDKFLNLSSVTMIFGSI